MDIFENTVKLFKKYQVENKKQKIVELLKSFLSENSNLDDMQICWALWNISDNLAMLRNYEEEFKNHKLFEKKLIAMDKKYLHWIVSDGTQKMTLLIGGYENYWNELYQYACKNTTKNSENSIIRFESHRANVAFPTAIDYKFNIEHSCIALENLKQSCIELKSTTNYKFYNLTYYTRAIGFNALIKGNHKQYLDESYNAFLEIIPYLNCTKQLYEDGKEYLIGSFERLNSPRSKYNQAFCGINNYIIQLVNAGEYKIALQCNYLISKYSLNYGKYYDSKIQLAKDNNITL